MNTQNSERKDERTNQKFRHFFKPSKVVKFKRIAPNNKIIVLDMNSGNLEYIEEGYFLAEYEQIAA